MKKSQLRHIIREAIKEQRGGGRFSKSISLDISQEESKELEQLIGSQSGTFDGGDSEKKKKCKWRWQWFPPELIIECE